MLQHLFLFVSHINALIVFLNVSSISGETISGPQSSHVREERAHEQHTHLVQSHTPTETSLSTNKSKHTPSLHSHCATPTRRAPRSVAIVHPSSSHLCARSFVGRIYIYIFINPVCVLSVLIGPCGTHKNIQFAITLISEVKHRLTPHNAAKYYTQL